MRLWRALRSGVGPATGSAERAIRPSLLLSAERRLYARLAELRRLMEHRGSGTSQAAPCAAAVAWRRGYRRQDHSAACRKGDFGDTLHFAAGALGGSAWSARHPGSAFGPARVDAHAALRSPDRFPRRPAARVRYALPPAQPAARLRHPIDTIPAQVPYLSATGAARGGLARPCRLCWTTFGRSSGAGAPRKFQANANRHDRQRSVSFDQLSGSRRRGLQFYERVFGDEAAAQLVMTARGVTA